MIEINLLPGSVKKSKRATPTLSGGPLAGMSLPKMDKVLASAIGMWVFGIAAILWMHTSSTAKLEALSIEEERLVAERDKMSVQVAQNRILSGKRDTVAAKLNIIQELDGGRFHWAHIMDEVSRAVPDYTWLTSITPSADNGPTPAFVIEGRMGNAFALPKFMKALEDSPFIAGVTLRSSGPVEENGKSVYSFQLEAQYEEPPIDLITTVPLFAGEANDSMSVPLDDAGAAAAGAAAPAAAAGAPAGGQ